MAPGPCMPWSPPPGAVFAASLAGPMSDLVVKPTAPLPRPAT